jgi:hypothetical protein
VIALVLAHPMAQGFAGLAVFALGGALGLAPVALAGAAILLELARRGL